jgi:hypothetical protein
MISVVIYNNLATTWERVTMWRLRMISDHHVKDAVGENLVLLPYGEVPKLWVAKSMDVWVASIMHLLLGTHYLI